MTVYVTQRPIPNNKNWVPDLGPANQYGPLKFVFESDEKVVSDPKLGMERAFDRLEDFDSEKDYLLWHSSGDPAVVWAIIMALVELGHNSITFLYWDRKLIDGERSRTEGYYVPLKLELTTYNLL